MGITYQGVRPVKYLEDLKPGDHVRIKHLLYDHHFVVIEVIDHNYAIVVHFSAKGMYDFYYRTFPAMFIYFGNYIVLIGSLLKFGALLPAIVRKQTLFINLKNDVQVLDYSPGQKIYSPEEITKRAQLRVGEMGYNMFSKNCEAFINDIIIGQQVSNQAKHAFVAGLVLVTLLVLVISFISIIC